MGGDISDMLKLLEIKCDNDNKKKAKIYKINLGQFFVRCVFAF
jgi:hypothetical protein